MVGAIFCAIQPEAISQGPPKAISSGRESAVEIVGCEALTTH
jgi:hypothetical protein